MIIFEIIMHSVGYAPLRHCTLCALDDIVVIPPLNFFFFFFQSPLCMIQQFIGLTWM